MPFRRGSDLNANPSVLALLQRAVQQHQAGAVAQAESLYRQVLSQDPRNADALNLLGVLAGQTQQPDAAVSLFRQAIEIQPDFAAACVNLGKCLKDMGRPAEAIAALRRAIAIQPQYPKAHCILGEALRDAGDLAAAITAYQAALALQPNYPVALNDLGSVYYAAGHYEDACASYRQAICLDPAFADPRAHLGTALLALDRPEEAIAAFQQAMTLKPDFADAACNLGNAFQAAGRLPEAIASFRRATAAKPDFADAHWNLALALLLTGDFEHGWTEFEWRWKWSGFQRPRPDLPQPLWDGKPFPNRTLLIHAEQGFGDTLQFVRHLPQVAQRGGKVILECQPELKRLLKDSAGDWSVVARGEPFPVPDLQCPLLTLPMLLQTDASTIPNSVPYLKVDEARKAHWQQRLSRDADGIKVGLAWAGNKAHKNDRNRSMPLAALAPLAGIAGVRLYSLQKSHVPAGGQGAAMAQALTDWTSDLADFADTAALVANLDLVISVDTAVAHLAGALNRPLWVLLPMVPDWRWLMDRPDSLWYPSARLFRQPARGEWSDAVGRVAESLGKLVV